MKWESVVCWKLIFITPSQYENPISFTVVLLHLFHTLFLLLILLLIPSGVSYKFFTVDHKNKWKSYKTGKIETRIKIKKGEEEPR